MIARFKVWHIPQVPMKAFEVPVLSPSEGFALCATLAGYDIFQFENNIKPDYCNANGVVYNFPPITGNEWWDVEEDEIDDLLAEIQAKSTIVATT